MLLMKRHAKNFTNVIVHGRPFSSLFSISGKKSAIEPKDEYEIYNACPAFTRRRPIRNLLQEVETCKI
jgi:hypothetical protein